MGSGSYSEVDSQNPFYKEKGLLNLRLTWYEENGFLVTRRGTRPLVLFGSYLLEAHGVPRRDSFVQYLFRNVFLEMATAN